MKLKVFCIALTAVALAACSSRPTEPAASAPVQSLASTPAATPAAPTTPATAAVAVPTTNGEPPVLNRKLIAQGYKPTKVGDEIYYCRMIDVTNTAFKKKVCLNEAQLRDQERKTRELQEKMDASQWSPACQPFPSCAG